jgi:hypothetical protein
MQFKVDNLKFENILDYDDFSVWYDFSDHTYIYVDEDGNTSDLYCIARLTYDINNLPNDPDDRLFHTLFDNFCCGEQVTDDEIIYWWFKEK